MRLFFATVLLLTLSVGLRPALGDQNAPQLGELFEQLQAAPDETAAQPIESRIWALWLKHEDSAVNGLMETGLGQMAQRDYASALDTFADMVDLAPEFAEGWNKKATVHWLLGNYQDSLADIEKTLALEPRHFGALSGRGLVYINLEEWELALEAFDDALEVHPQMVGPRVNASALRTLLEGHPI